MAEFGSWLRKELREIFPVWAFFFVSFSLLAFTLSAVLGQYHVEAYEPPEYFVGSLIVAKAVILIDAFLKTAWLRGRPLIYATLLNTGIYSVAALAVRHFERIFSLMRRQHLGFVQANHEVFGAMGGPRYWVTVVWLIALIFAFCMLRELIRAIGVHRFMEIFFGRRQPQSVDIRKVS